MHPTCIIRCSAAIICKSTCFCYDYSVLLLSPTSHPIFSGSAGRPPTLNRASVPTPASCLLKCSFSLSLPPLGRNDLLIVYCLDLLHMSHVMIWCNTNNVVCVCVVCLHNYAFNLLNLHACVLMNLIIIQPTVPAFYRLT